MDYPRTSSGNSPDIKVVFGNAHASSLGAPLLEHFPGDRLPVHRRGRGRAARYGRRQGAGATSPTWSIATAERIVSNPRRARIVDLDDLPFPAYEKLAGFPQGYHLPLFAYEKRWGATMITSRGCPYTCSFCDRTVFERLYK